MRFIASKQNDSNCTFDTVTVDAKDSADALRILKRDAWTKHRKACLQIYNPESGETDIYALKNGRTFYSHTSQLGE